MDSAWANLVQAAKHRSRFYFHALQPASAGERDHSPAKVLRTLREIVAPLGLIQRFPLESLLYRARVCDDTWLVESEAEFWAPPPEKARAGRMNPAGISYLYLAEQPGTALAEVVQRPPCKVAVGCFQLRVELLILDITKLPPPDSGKNNDEQDALHFLHCFRDIILQPVQKGPQEHIDYVPSQIVCEFLAQVHEMKGEKNSRDEPWPRLHGIRYQSVIHPSGINVVLFPTTSSTENHGGFDELVERIGADPDIFDIHTWKDLGEHIAISPGTRETAGAKKMAQSS
jgi:hypothetical protein